MEKGSSVSTPEERYNRDRRKKLFVNWELQKEFVAVGTFCSLLGGGIVFVFSYLMMMGLGGQLPKDFLTLYSALLGFVYLVSAILALFLSAWMSRDFIGGVMKIDTTCRKASEHDSVSELDVTFRDTDWKIFHQIGNSLKELFVAKGIRVEPNVQSDGAQS